MLCYGQTKSTNCATKQGSGDGSLQAANIKVSSADSTSVTFLAPSTTSPIQAFGDSGGSCLFGDQMTGINSTGQCGVDSITLKGSEIKATTMVGPEAYRSWVANWLKIRRHADTQFSSASTISGFSTYINDADLNGHPNAVLEVTSNWNPGGVGGVYDTANLSVWYDGSVNQWAIFNQNFANVASGTDFNDVVSPGGAARYIATASNTQVFVMNPGLGSTDSNLNAILIVTPSWNGVINDHPVGVYYNAPAARWAVINEDLQAIPPNAALDVWIADPKQGSDIHQSTASDVSGNSTYLGQYEPEQRASRADLRDAQREPQRGRRHPIRAPRRRVVRRQREEMGHLQPGSRDDAGGCLLQRDDSPVAVAGPTLRDLSARGQ